MPSKKKVPFGEDFSSGSFVVQTNQDAEIVVSSLQGVTALSMGHLPQAHNYLSNRIS